MATEEKPGGLLGRAAGVGAVLKLERENGHPRDAFVRFDEEPHDYYIRNPETGKEHKVSTSVTTLIGTCHDGFEPLKAVDAMRRAYSRPGGNPKWAKEPWPREEYKVSVKDATDAEKEAAYAALREEAWPNLCAMTAAHPLEAAAKVKAMMSGSEEGGNRGWPRPDYMYKLGRKEEAPRGVVPDDDGYVPMTEDQVLSLWAGRRPAETWQEAAAGWAADGDRRGMTVEEIAAKWKAKGESASALGTNMHALLELHANGEPYEIDPACPSAPDTRMGVKWLEEMRILYGMVPWRTEWIVYDEDYDVAGSLDLVMIDRAGDLHIVDYKRCGTQKAGFAKSFGRKMHPPLAHIDDCDKMKWCCQVNAYRHIIEKNYGKRVKSMRMAVFLTEENPNPVVFIHPRDDSVVRLLTQNADRAAVLRKMEAAEGAGAPAPTPSSDDDSPLRPPKRLRRA